MFAADVINLHSSFCDFQLVFVSIMLKGIAFISNSVFSLKGSIKVAVLDSKLKMIVNYLILGLGEVLHSILHVKQVVLVLLSLCQLFLSGVRHVTHICVKVTAVFALCV